MDPSEPTSAATTPATASTPTTTTATGTTTTTTTTATTRNGTNTDSMVTVPLSDIQSNSEHSQPDWCSLDIPPTPPIDLASPTEQQSNNGLKSSDVGDSPLRSPSSERNDASDAEGDVVDWAQLDKTEEREPRGRSSDESTALLLARLEQENNALATNPKSGLPTVSHTKKRSQSLNHIKRLIKDDSHSTLRYSQLPPPPMTELEFWAALVSDYHQTAQRLPTLTTNKIRGGVPPPLRGVVWPSLAGARDQTLLVEYQQLCGETSPYEGLIGKDIGRSFPNVDMFRDPNGEGQQMLARVLKCFSLYDTKIGYCQGLGFVVGPLLMHMTDAEAFCVLVRLMDHYNLRNCYLPDLSGLHLHVYQFQNLLARHRPALFAHLESLHVEPVYVSQWFLSFFAVACPLPMLLRIYDIIFLEGACETLMRVALSLMQRNEKRIMACTEFEDVMQLLLSRSLWDTYASNAEDLVNDFVSLTSLVTKESLQTLEVSYNQSQGVPTGISFPQMQAAASRFLGRLWAGSSSHNSVKSFTLNPNHTSASNPTIRRSTSKQSMTSTLNSIESGSDASTALTELSAESQKPRTKSATSHRDRDLHTQIEDLLMALSDLQRQQADLSRDLQLEREEREEDQELAQSLLKYVKNQTGDKDQAATELVAKAEERFASTVEGGGAAQPDSNDQTRDQLRDDLKRYKEMHQVETSRSQGLSRRVEEQERENSSLQEQIREARGRIQNGYRDRQRLEAMVRELRTVKTSEKPPRTPPDQTACSPSSERGDGSTPTNGLRELKLVRSNSTKNVTRSPSASATPTTIFNKRSSGLGLRNVLATESHELAPEENLLAELVTAKTAEAVAKQELEEVKGKFDSLRRMVSSSHQQQQQQEKQQKRLSMESVSSLLNLSPTSAGITKTATEPVSSSSSGGFWSGWGRRAVSGSTNPDAVETK